MSATHKLPASGSLVPQKPYGHEASSLTQVFLEASKYSVSLHSAGLSMHDPDFKIFYPLQTEQLLSFGPVHLRQLS